MVEAVSIILCPCKMMDASFAKCKTSHSMFLLRHLWRTFYMGRLPPQKEFRYGLFLYANSKHFSVAVLRIANPDAEFQVHFPAVNADTPRKKLKFLPHRCRFAVVDG